MCFMLTAAEVAVGHYQPAYAGSKINYHIGVTGKRSRLVPDELCPLLFDRRQAQIRSVLSATSRNEIRESTEGVLYAV